MIQNPKRSSDTAKDSPRWYDYYAGYSLNFTKSALEAANLTPNSIVLDPWNGAGTTTKMCSISGYRSVGVDLNPVMVVIAKAKLASTTELNIAYENSKKLNSRFKVQPLSNDLLNSWFTSESVINIRKIEKFILNKISPSTLDAKVSSLSNVQCLYYISLFNTVRNELTDFIPSNPTWIKKAKYESQKVVLDWKKLRRSFRDNLEKLLKNRLKYPELQAASEIILGSSTSLPVKDLSIDLVLSSPPYCTRIDYGVATLPELAILSGGNHIDADIIRRSLMGSTTVPKEVNENIELGFACNDFLMKIKNHPSKASSTYYYKNFLQYFNDLFNSIVEISRVLKPNGTCILVVQDSYYKDIHCDLARIIIDMFNSNKFKHIQSHEFQSKSNMANINPRGKVYRNKTQAIETALFFKRLENE
ncbi:DNA methyltransferase [Grimontia hollisae]|uniref:DNA methyltransferase n=1 Tax=Grimontia hollisae TaxID=673 RepID=UPI000DFD803E|nr:DNA methyltransferase [Grimontia hollisae]STQ77010.1 DNA methylase [Grimontia hollisae]